MLFNPELCRNESEVESKLIVQYLLPQLGYTPDTWHQEVALGSIRLDFLAFAAQVIPFVLDANSPLSVVMEAKHPKQNLNNHVLRLRHYLTSLNVRYGLLTNGKEIRIYEKFKNDVQLVFQCYGKEVEKKIDKIKNFIGRDSLKEEHLTENSQIQVSENNLNFQTERQYSMKTIAIYHNKGGVGKTTVAVNLAAALRKKGKSVLLIDIDSQANTTFATGLIKFQFEEDDDLREQNISHLLESADFNFIPEILRQSNYFNDPEIDVVPSHINLIDKQDKLNKIAVSRSRLISKLKIIETHYDIVIIDTPPSRDYYAEVALIASDYLIIPSDLKPFANQGLPTVKNFIKQINEYRGLMSKEPINIIGVLASKISTNSKFLQYTFPRQRSTISERYNLPLMEAVIYDRTALSECMNNTITVGDLEYPDPRSIIKYADLKTNAQQSAMEFEMLAKEVLQKIGVN
ncbi:AAA family ATPase [Komarekiella sp. 'clone 1']|uniref:AAA family ATPase n=1 Tax=Komarekiella delphini-convector SJRDD-AB1 TaxID=2593771 RepID=A0AA40T014_9NOST|nr:AAA family ATPase [Komarekiella delphini-convector]MBD6618115.1 AAA family ATPase [Komarekiella delphini-convector SJRDD-AB1]